ncbi:MAG TPA: AarF/UbiB family protein, partial [Candidatus Xenobia bacterium]
EVLEAELGQPVAAVFSSIEEQCTAAASLAQVHKAVLAATGETVAVKVQRPHIEALVRMDLSTLHFVIRVVKRLTDTRGFMDLDGLYREFRRTVYEEIDYVQEARNAERFRTMFENDPYVWIPHVYPDYVRPRMLVLQWVDGIKVNDYAALDAAGIDRDQVARYLVEAYFHQFFIAGFFHADPHPGNIFIRKDGPRVYLIDFGMVGTLTPDMQKALRDLFSSYLTRDARRLVKALARLGFIGSGANIEAIEQAVDLILQRYYGMTLREARDLDVGDVAHDIEALLYGQPFQVPARFAFTGKAIGTLVGVSTGLAPNFNFVAVAAPYARQFLGVEEEQVARQVLDQVLQIGQILLRLPGLLERVAVKLESGRLAIRTGEGGRRRRRTAAGTADWGGALVACASVAGGAALLMAGQAAGGWFCLALAALAVWRRA